MKHIPESILSIIQKTSSKTVSDRFKWLSMQIRESNKRTIAASGIAERYEEKDILIYDLIFEIDEKDETMRDEKEQYTWNEKRLLAVRGNLDIGFEK